MTAVPDDVTATHLTEVLLDSVDDPCHFAAIQLLAEHGVWLNRAPIRACIDWEPEDDEYSDGATVRWSDIAALTEDGVGPATGSEVAVLAVAHSIAVGPLNEAATRCDNRNWALIVRAILSVRSGG
jgi:hypothetical protein